MSIFKKKPVFWYLSYFLSGMFTIWAYRISLRNGATGLHRFYQMEFKEFIVITLVLPIFSGIVLKKIADYMYYSKILNMGSRCKWQHKLMKELTKVSMKYSLVLLAPMSIAIFLFSEDSRKLSGIMYCLFSYIMYAGMLTMMAAVILEIKIQWNLDVAAILGVLGIALIPSIFTKVCIRSQTITFSEIINAPYVFANGKYLWMLHAIACAATWIVLKIVYQSMKYQINKKDLLWRQSGNEN